VGKPGAFSCSKTILKVERAMPYPGPDDELYWREEAFGEHPILSPWGDPHHPPETVVIQIDPNSD